MSAQLRPGKIFSTALLATAGLILFFPSAAEPMILALLPIPYLLTPLLGTNVGVIPFFVGIGVLAKRPWARRFSVYYSLLVAADGAAHLALWFWTGGLVGPPFGFLGVGRILEGAYLAFLALRALKDWNRK